MCKNVIHVFVLQYHLFYRKFFRLKTLAIFAWKKHKAVRGNCFFLLQAQLLLTVSAVIFKWTKALQSNFLNSMAILMS